jgi:SAM-dependent methyltransferase
MVLRDTDADWAKLATEDPFWAVLSQDGLRGDTLPEEKLRSFFQTGESQIARIFGFIKRHLQEDFRPKRSLDFGCGVGRLLIPLARLSEEAVGVDVAAGMLQQCRKFLLEQGISNVTLFQNDDLLRDISGHFDFINTQIVLQHIPPERGYYLVERLIKLLKVGGVGSIQVTYAKARRFLAHEGGRARFYRREGSIIHDVAPLPDDRQVGTIIMFDYDLNNITATLSLYAGHPILMLPTQDDDHLGAHFVFQRAR